MPPARAALVYGDFRFLGALFCSLLALAMLLVPSPAFGAAQPSPEQATTVARQVITLDSGDLNVGLKRTSGGGVAADITLRGPSVRIVRRTKDAPPEILPEDEPPPDPAQELEEALPFPLRIDRVDIHDASIVFMDETVPGRELVRIHGLEIVIENFSTRRDQSGGRPTLITARGQIGRDGDVALFATINPWSDEMDFAGRAQVVGLRLEELRGFLVEGIDLEPADGRFTAFVEFSVHQGQIRGGVRPILEDVELVAPDPGFFDQLREGVADVAFDLFSDDIPGRRAIVTDVPIRGSINDPEADLWRTFVGILENAFIEAIAVGFQNVLPRGS